jgi:hypothetical protein
MTMDRLINILVTITLIEMMIATGMGVAFWKFLGRCCLLTSYETTSQEYKPLISRLFPKTRSTAIFSVQGKKAQPGRLPSKLSECRDCDCHDPNPLHRFDFQRL